MAELTADQIQELKMKVMNDEATSEEEEAYAEHLKKSSAEKKKAETSVASIIASLKKANISVKILTNLLAKEGLIEVEKKEEKIFIFEKAIKTKTDRDGSFKIWVGRDCKALTGDAKKHWEDVKKEGKEAFLKNLNETGQKMKDEAKFKAWIEQVFA